MISYIMIDNMITRYDEKSNIVLKRVQLVGRRRHGKIKYHNVHNLSPQNMLEYATHIIHGIIGCDGKSNILAKHVPFVVHIGH
jgi:hypothetical protein